MDFMSDHTADGRSLRMLVVLDECTHECLAIEVDRHCRAEDVVQVLDELLSSEIFATLAEARLLVDRWRLHYNHRRIQRALGKRTPAAFAVTCPALPPLRLAMLACAAAPPGLKGVATIRQLS
jgi:transposase InsO family protein